MRIPKRTLGLTTVFLGVVLSAPPVTRAAGAQSGSPWITPLVTTYDLRADTDTVEVRVPVTLSSVPADKVKVRITDVSLGNRRETRLTDAFAAKMETGKPDRGPAIILAVALRQRQEVALRQETSPGLTPRIYQVKLPLGDSRVLTPGTYQVQLEAVAEEPAGQAPQSVTLQIIHPPAKLWSPATLIVEQVVPFFRGSPEIQSQGLALRETSNRSWLTDLTVSQLDIPGDTNQPTKERIVFKEKLDIAPSAPSSAGYALTGAFPVGTTKGTIGVNAPQLESPLVVNFEVRARRVWWSIFVFITVGLLVGYLVRTVLQTLIDWHETRLKAAELKKRIYQERQRHQDGKFRDRVTEILENLEAAEDARKADTFVTAITNANTELTDALNDLKQRRATALTAQGALLRLTTTGWSLPGPVAEVLKSVGNALGEVAQELDKDAVEVANNKLEATRARLAENLGDPVAQWQTSMSEFLADLSKPEALLPAGVIPRLKQAVDVLTPLLSQIPSVDPNATVEQLQTTLAAIHGVYKRLSYLMQQLQGWLRSTAAGVTDTLKKVQIPEQSAVGRLGEKVTEIGRKLVTSVDRPREAAQELSGDLAKLHEAWSDALLKQIPYAAEADKKTVSAAIEKRNYEEAARQVMQILQPKRDEGGALGGVRVEPETLPGAGPTPELWAGLFEAPVVPAPFPRAERVEEPFAGLEVERRQTWRELFVAKFLQTLLVGSGIVLVGYLIFAETFFGTAKDIAKMFFWAFSIDVSVNALVDAAKKI